MNTVIIENILWRYTKCTIWKWNEIYLKLNATKRFVPTITILFKSSPKVLSLIRLWRSFSSIFVVTSENEWEYPINSHFNIHIHLWIFLNHKTIFLFSIYFVSSFLAFFYPEKGFCCNFLSWKNPQYCCSNCKYVVDNSGLFGRKHLAIGKIHFVNQFCGTSCRWWNRCTLWSKMFEKQTKKVYLFENISNFFFPFLFILLFVIHSIISIQAVKKRYYYDQDVAFVQ